MLQICGGMIWLIRSKTLIYQWLRVFEETSDNTGGYVRHYFGNVDNVRDTTAADARTVLRISSRLQTSSIIQSLKADVDGDGEVTAADARLILRRSSNLIPDFNPAKLS